MFCDLPVTNQARRKSVGTGGGPDAVHLPEQIKLELAGLSVSQASFYICL